MGTSDETAKTQKRKGTDKVSLKFDYTVYATRPDDFQTWIDRLVTYFRVPVVVIAPLIAILVYLLGLLVSALIDFDRYYIRTIPVYVGVFGIFWVILFIRYASRNFHRAYEELRPCFLIPDQVYKDHIDTWFARMASWDGTLRSIILYILLAWVVVYISYAQTSLVENLNFESLRASLFGNTNWFAPENYWVKALLLAYFGVCVAFPLGTASRLLVVNFIFLLTLRKFPLIPLPSLLRTRLQRVTNIYLVITLSWFLGVSLFGAILFTSLDLIAVTGILVLSFLGMLTFFTPQAIYRLMLVRSNLLSSQWILAAFYRHFDIEIAERESSSVLSNNLGYALAEMDDLSGFIDASANEQLWVYNPGDVILLFLAQAVALASVMTQDILTKLFGFG